jgi:predicted amidohydrolase
MRFWGVCMKICFVTQPSLNNVWQERLSEISKQDIVVFGFNGLGLLSYKKELSGETEYFHDVANLSKQLSSVVISGCDTDTYGVFRHSVVIAEKGKILGVTDMVHSIDESEFVSGGTYRVFETSVCKIGILVKEDLFFQGIALTTSWHPTSTVVFGVISANTNQITIKASGKLTNNVLITEVMFPRNCFTIE